MGQSKEKSIITSISIICTMFIVFLFVVVENVVTANNFDEIGYINESMSDFVESKMNTLIVSNIISAKKEYKEVFDIQTDYSFQKYVSDKNLLQNSKYEPSDLTEITGDHIIIKTQRPYLRDVAANALKEMSQQFYDDMGHNIYLLSAYRSYKDQEKLRNEGCSTLKCAKNGGSEHQLGLAVDIHVANSQGGYFQFNSGYLDWMNENAYKYGFINTYRKGSKIDGKMNEIRHWRYVGVPFATELHEKDMSFAERVNSN